MELKAFMVGENDIVASESEQSAIDLMISEFGADHYGDMTVDDVTDLTAEIDHMVYDEEGKPIQTLREYVDACNGAPQYLYGWE